jgi:uncharacterized peroxidase-related enzyme
MAQTTAHGLPLVEEHEATGQVAALYAEIKRELHVPAIPNYFKALAASPATLAIFWTYYRAFLEHSTLPESLTAMILYAVAEQNECQYCSAGHELSCRTLGIDEATLHTLVHDLPQLTPARIRMTIQFALKVARAPKALVREDYDALRAQGVSDEELVELVHVAAMGSFGDVLADALKIEVEANVSQALGRR